MDNKEFTELLDRLARAWTLRYYEEVASYFNERLFYSDAINYSFFDRYSLFIFFAMTAGTNKTVNFTITFSTSGDNSALPNIPTQAILLIMAPCG